MSLSLKAVLKGTVDYSANVVNIWDGSGFYAPLKTTAVLALGTGSPTFTRATTAYVTDFEGLAKNCKSGEIRFTGARRVANLLTFTEDFSNAVWGASGAGAGSVAIKTPNYGVAPDGTLTACRVQVALNGGTTSGDISYLVQDYTVDATKTVRESCWIKTVSGDTKTIYFRGGNATTSYTISGEWTRLVSSASPMIGNSSIGIRGGLTPTCSDSADLLIWRPMLENVIGQSNQDPSEYVSVGVLSAPFHGAGVDGVKYFPYQNGNTVAANVVTEAQGAAIADATLKGYLAEPAATNYFLNSGAPATQTTASLGTGTYCCWVRGAGNIAIAGGTATITGGGSATAATPLVFAVTVAGTVVCTYTATLTFVQLENNAFPTSQIDTAGIAVTRNTDILSYPISGNVLGVVGTSYAEFTTNSSNAANYIYIIGSASNACMLIWPDLTLSILDSGVQRSFNTLSLPYQTKQKAATAWGGSRTNAAFNGGISAAVGFSGDLSLTGSLILGNDNTGVNYQNGNIRNVRIWQTQLSDAILRAITT